MHKIRLSSCLPLNPPCAPVSCGAPRRRQPSPRATSPIHHSAHAAVKYQLLGEACFGFPAESCTSPSPGRIQDHPRPESFREKRDFSAGSGSARGALCVPGELVGNGGSWGAETPNHGIRDSQP